MKIETEIKFVPWAGHPVGQESYIKGTKIFHCEDGPSRITFPHSDPTWARQEWCKFGQLSRLGGPAFEDDVTELWRVGGKAHRTSGPATIYFDRPSDSVNRKRTVEIWAQNGETHNGLGPAIVRWREGLVAEEEWWIDGQKHRLDGPACINYHQDQFKQEYWLWGHQYPEDLWRQLQPFLRSPECTGQYSPEELLKMLNKSAPVEQAADLQVTGTGSTNITFADSSNDGICIGSSGTCMSHDGRRIDIGTDDLKTKSGAIKDNVVTNGKFSIFSVGHVEPAAALSVTGEIRLSGPGAKLIIEPAKSVDQPHTPVPANPTEPIEIDEPGAFPFAVFGAALATVALIGFGKRQKLSLSRQLDNKAKSDLEKQEVRRS